MNPKNFIEYHDNRVKYLKSEVKRLENREKSIDKHIYKIVPVFPYDIDIEDIMGENFKPDIDILNQYESDCNTVKNSKLYQRLCSHKYKCIQIQKHLKNELYYIYGIRL